jgi:hypothetical protein
MLRALNPGEPLEFQRAGKEKGRIWKAMSSEARAVCIPRNHYRCSFLSSAHCVRLGTVAYILPHARVCQEFEEMAERDKERFAAETAATTAVGAAASTKPRPLLAATHHTASALGRQGGNGAAAATSQGHKAPLVRVQLCLLSDCPRHVLLPTWCSGFPIQPRDVTLIGAAGSRRRFLLWNFARHLRSGVQVRSPHRP